MIDNSSTNGNEFRHLAAWGLNLVPTDRPYIVTDGDCAITPDCPDDYVLQMLEVLIEFSVIKVGLGINTANFLDPVPEYHQKNYDKDALLASLTLHQGVPGGPSSRWASRSMFDRTWDLADGAYAMPPRFSTEACGSQIQAHGHAGLDAPFPRRLCGQPRLPRPLSSRTRWTGRLANVSDSAKRLDPRGRQTGMAI